MTVIYFGRTIIPLAHLHLAEVVNIVNRIQNRIYYALATRRRWCHHSAIRTGLPAVSEFAGAVQHSYHHPSNTGPYRSFLLNTFYD